MDRGRDMGVKGHQQIVLISEINLVKLRDEQYNTSTKSEINL
jgi:hypothetical protein